MKLDSTAKSGCPKRERSGRGRIALAIALGAGTALSSVGFVHAAEIDTGNPEVRMRWDNTVKYSTAFRVKDPSSALTAKKNEDDGDRNFQRGLISNRVDLLSEFDVSYRGFGVRVSGAGWYDTVYNRSNDHDSAATANQSSTSYDHFTDKTRRLHGRDAELLDAFVFGKVELAEDTSATFRFGRHALLWGESLFYGANGIAAGMAPIDIAKGMAVPNTQFKELVRPVEQISGQVQITPELAIGAYYQFRWEKNRFPAVGSYFSTTDIYDAGAESLKYFGTFAAAKGADLEARNSGQGGLQARFRLDETDIGLYAIQYHDKSPQLYFNRLLSGTPPGVSLPASFSWVYPEDIRALGASVSHSVGVFNLAGEASLRYNMPLNSSSQLDLYGIVPALFGGPSSPADNDGNPLYAVGRTAHINLSWLATLPPNFLSDETAFLGELACNRVLSVTKNRAALNPNVDRDACNFRVVYEPSYRQVVSGLDISVPVGFGIGFGNSAAVGSAFNGNHVGDINIGVKGVYENTWQLGLSYTHYFGPEGTYLDQNNDIWFKQDRKDRDFIAMTVSRTF